MIDSQDTELASMVIMKVRLYNSFFFSSNHLATAHALSKTFLYNQKYYYYI